VTKIVDGQVIVTRSVDPNAYEHFARALLYEEEGRHQEAIGEIKRALNFDSEAPELYARLAELLLHLDRLDEAARAVRTSLRLGETVPGLVADAHLRQRRRDLAGAVAALRRAVALANFAHGATEAVAAHLELAEAQVLALDLEGAKLTLRALVEAAPAAAAARVRLATLLWALGACDEAEARLQEALAEEPNQFDALLMLAWLQTAQGRVAEARARFEEALERAEGALEIGIMLARFLVTVGALDDAGQVADDLGDAGGDDSNLLGRIELERAARRPERALAIARTRRQAGDITEEVRARIDMVIADVLDDQGSRDEAVRVFLAIPKSTASFGESRLRAASVLREQGKTDEASRLLAEAMTGATDEALELEVAIAQALTDEKAGAFDKAHRRLAEALAKRPESSRLVLTQAQLLERRGSWRQALNLVEKLLAADPGNTDALNFWGFVAADHGHDLRRARQRVRAALVLEPGSGAILDSLGWAHFRLGELPQASLFLEQASRLEPEDPEILGHLAELYARQGKRDRAEKALRKALGGKTDEPLRRRLEEQLRQLETARGG
jgi:tetratricopeptide (TPR) repeat protein